MTKKNFKNLETLCVQAGYEPKSGQPRVVPIVQSTTFKYDSTETVANLFDLKEGGFFYTRLGNPTTDALEKKIAALDGGVAAVATSSGQSANLNAVLNITKAGENIVALNNVYGGTFNLLGTTLIKYGIEARFVSCNDFEELERNIDSKTRLILGEVLANPSTQILDIEKYAQIAHSHNIPLIVDNTLTTPVLCKPIDFGADVVTYASTKYLEGHATTIGGLIVDSGNFNWSKGNYPCLTEKDESYHGLVFTEAFGKAAYAARIRTVLLRDFGNAPSPFNAFLTILGIDTLFLRLERHSQNALKIAEFLEKHEKVEFVNYPFLKSSPDYELAKKYLRAGSGVISFGIKGGREEAAKFIDSLELLTLVVHVSDVRSYALHPASSTHRQLSDEELKKAGIPGNLIRLSIGIENADDLISDIDNALRA
ncbi:O-acetylhomoserine aminocarboxypropyltransferase/cysteine synthase family protein [Peptoniphilus raoultii]|uniref:O-acetylhomoserine aminocarboxypropyltransferase/cysteine synthase family protein n=1 Tax=Peptoniphilus raoultii TaxID=1776387 RepID=UPI0008D98E94|nr:O-acetylhomoserine aminocarboxypropyltransferase/cysteine synthase family protein [Peptoniphilus raoultii]